MLKHLQIHLDKCIFQALAINQFCSFMIISVKVEYGIYLDMGKLLSCNTDTKYI